MINSFVYVHVYNFTDPSENERKLCLGSDGSTFYGVERARSGGDVLKLLDLGNSGATRSMHQLPNNMAVKWMRLIGPNDRYC